MNTTIDGRDAKPNQPTAKSVLRVLLVTVAILLVPAVAMQFTNEVNWGPGDFVVAGLLLAGTGVTYELLVKKLVNAAWRRVAAVALGAALLLVWAELAVGIVGG